VGKALGLTEDVPRPWPTPSGAAGATTCPTATWCRPGSILRTRSSAGRSGWPTSCSAFPPPVPARGGFILTQRRLDETVPILNGAMADRTFIEWDKDDIDALA
jgi:error-prone DNA polymerase